VRGAPLPSPPLPTRSAMAAAPSLGARYLPPEQVLGILVGEGERAALEEAVADVAASVGAPRGLSRPCHYMVYGHQADTAEALAPAAASASSPARTAPGEHEEGAVSALRQFSERLVQKLLGEGGTEQARIISIRVLFAPPGCEGQHFHLDYGQAFEAVDTIFVAFTTVTAGNCTEVLDWRSPSDAAAALQYARAVGKRLDGRALHKHVLASRRRHKTAVACDEAPLAQIMPLESAQWGVWVVPTSHCLHRRGPTLSGEGSGPVRVTLNIDVARPALDPPRPVLAEPSLGPPCPGTSDECPSGSTSDGGSSPDEEMERSSRRAAAPLCKKALEDKHVQTASSAKRFQDSLGAFVCVDTLSSLQSGRICWQEVIDDLSEQDIYLHGGLSFITEGQH